MRASSYLSSKGPPTPSIRVFISLLSTSRKGADFSIGPTSPDLSRYLQSPFGQFNFTGDGVNHPSAATVRFDDFLECDRRMTSAQPSTLSESVALDAKLRELGELRVNRLFGGTLIRSAGALLPLLRVMPRQKLLLLANHTCVRFSQVPSGRRLENTRPEFGHSRLFARLDAA